MTVVIKIGGARAVDPAGALSDVAALREDGVPVVVVHGGSTALDDTLERLGMTPEYVETPSGVVGRFTDEDTMEVFKMVFGKLNTNLTMKLQNQSVNAIGLNGVDGRLLTGERKSAVRVVEDGRKKIRRGDHSGRIDAVNTGLLERLLTDGYTPVVGPPVLADDGVAVNTDADRASGAIAGRLDGRLVSLTDVDGVFEDANDPSTLISDVRSSEELESLHAVAEGFMRRKVMAAVEALELGASKVIISNANGEQPVLDALGGAGTHIHPEVLV